MKFLIFLIAFGTFFVIACHKENLPTLDSNPITASNNVENAVTDRGDECIRHTLDWHLIAAPGSGSIAFKGNWMQELDLIANNCVIPKTQCVYTASSGQTNFCCESEFMIFTILASGGLGNNWPDVTPAEQDFIIAYTLDWARTHLPACPTGVLKITAVDYYRDALITGSLGFTVRWSCCSGTPVDHQ